MPKLDPPVLENLRKRAKTLVRQHRERYYPVAARLRATVERFAALSDEAILDAAFTLSDAQRVVAEEVGHADWVQATKELRNMPPRPKKIVAASTPRLRVAFPQLFVADVRRAAEYYQEKLGFSMDYLYGEPPFYGLVSRDGVGLNLRYVSAPVLKREENLLSANLVVDEVKALFVEWQARGVDFAQTLRLQPWGASDFIVRDPDGNLLCFASPVETLERARKT